MKLARATATIKADESDVDSKLQALIVHWLANNPGATWQMLVHAMKMSKENVAAAELAKDVGASYTGIVLITIITTTYDKLNHMHSQYYQFPYGNMIHHCCTVYYCTMYAVARHVYQRGLW